MGRLIAPNAIGFAVGGAIPVPSPNELPLNRITTAKNKVMKPKNEMSAGTAAEQRTKDEVYSSPPADAKPNVVGSQSLTVDLSEMSKIWLNSEYLEKRKQSYDTLFKIWVEEGSSLLP